MKLKKDKVSGIIKNVLYESYFQQLVLILNSTYFSVIIENTDIRSFYVFLFTIFVKERAK